MKSIMYSTEPCFRARLCFLLGGSQDGWDRILSKWTVEDASPYEFDEILNLGDTPYDAIVV